SSSADVAFANFVSEAHARNIKVVLDVQSHSVSPSSSMVTDHFPVSATQKTERVRSNLYWKYYRTQCPQPNPSPGPCDSSDFSAGRWGGMYDYDYDNQSIQDFSKATLLRYVTTSGVDGFRCDLEPGAIGDQGHADSLADAAGLGFWTELAITAQQQTGKRLL